MKCFQEKAGLGGVTVSLRSKIRVLSCGGLVTSDLERQEVAHCSRPGLPGSLVLVFFFQTLKF